MSYCYNCGVTSEFKRVYPIDDSLKNTWEISDDYVRLFNAREGRICENCGINIRAQGLARAILKSKFGYGKKTLSEWVSAANQNKLKVCELNSCHELHQTLKNLQEYTYAEYGGPNEQNIEALTYADNSFDLVLHSETLEHVSDPGKAMDECRRVLSDNGIVLFTTPVIWSRLTRRRASIEGGEIHKILPPSYHGFRTDDYLVFQEYGRDIGKVLGVDIALADHGFQNYVFYSAKKPATTPFYKILATTIHEQIILNTKAPKL